MFNRIRDTLDNATTTEFDQECPTLVQMRPSIYLWRRDIIPPNPTTRLEIDVTCDWVRLPSGESTIKGNRTFGNDPNNRVILQSSS